MPKFVTKSKRAPSSRSTSQETALNLATGLPPMPKKPDQNTPPKKFLKWNFEEDFGDSD